MLGLWPIDTLKNCAFIDFVHPECKDLIRADLKDLAEEKLRMPLKLVRPDSMPVEVKIAAILYAASTAKKSDAMMVIARDVTERNRALTAVEQREENLRIVMDAVADGIVAVDENGNIEMANAAIEGMFGTSAQTLIDKHISVLLPDFKGVKPKNFNSITSTGNNESELSGAPELLGNRTNGTTLPVEVVFNETTSAGRQRYIGAIRDVTARKTYEDRLRTMATRDALTDLANWNLLDERLGGAIRKVDAEGGNLGLIYIDLDQFKNINDVFGHEVGDEVIKLAAMRIMTCVGENDLVARVGGDEFHILMSGILTTEEPASLAEDLLVALSSPYVIEDREIFSPASIGVGTYPAQANSKSEFLRNVDNAANYAKRDGRANYKSYTPQMSKEVHRRVSIGHQLRRALENDELSLNYQAKVNLSTQQIIDAEALLRWHSEDLGFVSPEEFIPIAEETGLIVPIGEWVLATACKQTAEWRSTAGQPIHVAVNLSALQFLHGDLVKKVASSLDASGLDPAHLDLELTESLLVERPDETIRILNHFKSMGISISMDDFGTGYSSLSYLTRLPLDSLKVDRAFVTNLPDDRDAVVVVRAIVGMAKELNLNIVAEGIETERQMEFLHGLICHTGQGYLFSKPIINDAFMQILTAKAAE